jgi:hypothetical protein
MICYSVPTICAFEPNSLLGGLIIRVQRIVLKRLTAAQDPDTGIPRGLNAGTEGLRCPRTGRDELGALRHLFRLFVRKRWTDHAPDPQKSSRTLSSVFGFDPDRECHTEAPRPDDAFTRHALEL